MLDFLIETATNYFRLGLCIWLFIVVVAFVFPVPTLKRGNES